MNWQFLYLMNLSSKNVFKDGTLDSRWMSWSLIDHTINQLIEKRITRLIQIENSWSIVIVELVEGLNTPYKWALLFFKMIIFQYKRWFLFFSYKYIMIYRQLTIYHIIIISDTVMLSWFWAKYHASGMMTYQHVTSLTHSVPCYFSCNTFVSGSVKYLKWRETGFLFVNLCIKQ